MSIDEDTLLLIPLRALRAVTLRPLREILLDKFNYPNSTLSTMELIEWTLDYSSDLKDLYRS